MRVAIVRRAGRALLALALPLVLCCCMLTGGKSAAQGSTPQPWTIEYLDLHVHDLQHELAGRMPILAWDLPDVPATDVAVGMRQTGALARNVQILWSKGIAPTVNLSAVSQGTGTSGGTLAVGATLQEQGVPVHIFANPPLWIGNWTLMTNGAWRHYPWDYWPQGTTHWFEYAAGFSGQLWPVFPLATPVPGYTQFGTLFAGLKAGDDLRGLPGVASAAGLWMDYEDLPYPWNGARASQQNGVIDGRQVSSFYDDTDILFPGDGRSVRQAYGADVLTAGTKLQQYSADLRAWLLRESAHKAFVEAYGSDALIGSYGDVFSSPGRPFYDQNDAAYAVTLRPGNVAMPVQYANNRYLRKYLGGEGQPLANQINADDVYWYLMLRSFSSSAANAGAGDRSVPWVTQYMREDLTGNFDYPMSPDLYRELLRHLWLRGAMGMYVFNPYRPSVAASNVYMTAQYSIEQLEYVRAVLDEMLCFRDFLERGEPMNFGYRPMFDHGPVWSGLARDGEAVVRIVGPNSDQGSSVAEIGVPNGATFYDLAAPPGGATYLLTTGGQKHRVDVRPAEVYLQMQRDFPDSSGNDHDVAVIRVASAQPVLSGDVAAETVLQGAYGLYANRANEHSVRLTRPTTDASAGDRLVVDVDGTGVDSVSFTAELLIKVSLGVNQDYASIVSQGRETGEMSWTLRCRDDGGTLGRLELGFAMDAATSVYLSTAGSPIVPDRWHHVAVVYDGANRLAQVYVDYELQAWEVQGDEVSESGVLSWDFRRRSGDRLVLGRFERGLNALIDEFRFTADALEPYQFLRTGLLH